jgi:hypothetical protein
LFDDGVTYYVKFQGNSQGTRVLVNEWVVSRLAQVVGFTYQAGAIVEVDQAFIAAQPALASFTAGLQYGSPLIPNHIPFQPGLLQSVTNRGDLPQIIILDTIFCYTDRHNNNLLLYQDGLGKPGDYKFRVIDNSHVVHGKPSWTEADLAQLEADQSPCVNAITFDIVGKQLGTFEPFLARVEAVAATTVEGIVTSTPPEWGLTASEQRRLTEFIVARKTLVRRIIQTVTDNP